MSGFEVTHDELAAHAAQLNAIAADVGTCREAGAAVGFGGTEAYGMFLQFVLPPVLEAALGDTCELLGQADELARAFSTGVRTNNDCYLNVDQDLGELLRSLYPEGR